MTDNWKEIPGFNGIYEIDHEGRIRRTRGIRQGIMCPSVKKGKQIIRLVNPDGNRTEFSVHTLMATTFIKGFQPGMSVYHLNGIKTDNHLNNLAVTGKSELGKLTGAKSKRKPVAKIDSTGEAVNFYPSARQAAKVNFMSYQTIIDRCNGKCRSKYAPDGFAYKWDD